MSQEVKFNLARAKFVSKCIFVTQQLKKHMETPKKGQTRRIPELLGHN